MAFHSAIILIGFFKQTGWNFGCIVDCGSQFVEIHKGDWEDIPEEYRVMSFEMELTGKKRSERVKDLAFDLDKFFQQQGITIGQYEKQCFWADRNWGNYQEPERHNPDRNIGPEREAPTHSRMEHKR